MAGKNKKRGPEINDLLLLISLQKELVTGNQPLLQLQIQAVCKCHGGSFLMAFGKICQFPPFIPNSLTKVSKWDEVKAAGE